MIHAIMQNIIVMVKDTFHKKDRHMSISLLKLKLRNIQWKKFLTLRFIRLNHKKKHPQSQLHL